MFGRRTRTLLSALKELLEPQLVRDVRERKLQRKEVQTRYFNRNIEELPRLDEGDVVRMKPQASNRKKAWTKAQVKKQVDVRSYSVRTEEGRFFRRNRRHLRQSKEPFMAKDAEVEIPSSVPNSPPPKVYTEPEPAQNSTGHPTTLSSNQSDPEPQVVRTAPLSAECQKNSAVTRSGRSIRHPSYSKDYVQS